MLSLDSEDGEVGTVEDKLVIKINLHPAAGGVIGPIAAINLGVAFWGVVSAGQGGFTGVLHVNGHVFYRIHICATGLVETDGFDGSGSSDLGGQIDGFMAGVVVVAIERVSLGRGTVTNDNYCRCTDFHVFGGVGRVLTGCSGKSEGGEGALRHGGGSRHVECEIDIAFCIDAAEVSSTGVDRDACCGAVQGSCSALGSSAAVVEQPHGDGHGFARIEPAVVIAGGIGDSHLTKGQFRGIQGEREVVSPRIVAAHGHGDGEIHHGAVGDIISEGDGKGVVCKHGSACSQAADAVVGVSNGDTGSGAAQHGAHVGGSLISHVFKGHIQVAAFVIFRHIVVGIIISYCIYCHKGPAGGHDGDVCNLGDAVLCGEHQFGGSGCGEGLDGEVQITGSVGDAGAVDHTIHAKANPGIGSSAGDGVVGVAQHDLGGIGGRVGGGNAHVGHQGRIAHDVVDFPIVVGA